MEVNIDTTMLDHPKGSSTLRIRTELEETLNANYPDYTQIFTDGSKMEERVGWAVVTPGENKEIQLPRPFSIFNAEAVVINTAFSIARNTIQPKRVILSYSLSYLTELDGMRKIYNPKVVRMRNQIHREKEHLILMWVSGHARIQENEKADQHAKTALQGYTNKNSKTVAEDWKNWIRKKQEEIRQAEWTSSDNPMVTIKPRTKKNNGAQALRRRNQFKI
jgi:hypothetical protein